MPFTPLHAERLIHDAGSIPLVTALSYRSAMLRKVLFALTFLLIAFSPLFVHQHSASAAETSETTCEINRVIVLMVDELRWEDITQQRTPFLHSLAAKSYIASLTTGRTLQDRTVISSFSTISAGTRTFDDGMPFSVTNNGDGNYVIGIDRHVKKNKNSLFEASIGSLQKTLTNNGTVTALVDPGLSDTATLNNASMLTITDNKGNVSNAFTSDNEVLRTRLDDAASSVLFSHYPAQAISSIDDQARTLTEKYSTEKTSVLLVGINRFETKKELLVVSLWVDGKHGLLASATRQRDGLIEQTDIGPTILNQLCLTPSNTMEGSPATIHQTGKFAQSRTQFIHDNRDAQQRESYTADSVATLLIIAIILAGLILAQNLVPALREKLQTPQKFISLVAINFFTATFIVNVFNPVDFNEWRLQTIVITIFLFIIAFVVEKYLRYGYLISIVILTCLLAVDVFTNNIFQANSAFGYSFISNSRSYGFSNIGSAAFSFGVIFLMFHYRRLFTRTMNKLACGFIFFIALALIGHPRFGADVGGALSSAPAFAIAFLYCVKIKIRLRWILLAGIFSVVAISLFAYVDYLRPSNERSHLGRLVNDVKTNGITPLAHTIERKLGAMLSTFSSLWFIIAIVCGLSLVVLHQKKAFLREIAIPLIVLAFFGTFLNDAGWLVGGSILLLSLCAALSAPEVRVPSIPLLENSAPIAPRA